MLPTTGCGQHLGDCFWAPPHDPAADLHDPPLDRSFHDLREQQPRRADTRRPASLATADPLTKGARDGSDIAAQAVHTDQHRCAARAGADTQGQRTRSAACRGAH